MDRVQIKGLGITCATDPGHHRLMRGVLRIVESIQKVRVLPDATAILGRTGPCAREAYGIVLPHFPGEHLCHAQFVLPAIAKVLLVEERVLCAPHQGCQGHRRASSPSISSSMRGSPYAISPTMYYPQSG